MIRAIARPFGRLGLRELVNDHHRTLVDLDLDGKPSPSRDDYILFGIVPITIGVVIGAANVRLRDVETLLAGASIFTALLFGLLVYVLQLGLQIAADDRVPANSRVASLTDELRSNVSWACGVGLVLTGILAALGAFVVEPSRGIHSWLSGIVVALTVHLGLTMFMVLKRVRSTFKMLGKY